MVDDYRACRLLRMDLELLGEFYSDALGLQELEEPHLELKVWARGVPE